MTVDANQLVPGLELWLRESRDDAIRYVTLSYGHSTETHRRELIQALSNLSQAIRGLPLHYERLIHTPEGEIGRLYFGCRGERPRLPALSLEARLAAFRESVASVAWRVIENYIRRQARLWSPFHD